MLSPTLDTSNEVEFVDLHCEIWNKIPVENDLNFYVFKFQISNFKLHERVLQPFLVQALKTC